MATLTTDYRAALEFINQAKIRHCYIPTPEAPDALRDEQELPRLIPYLGLGLAASLNDEGVPSQPSAFQLFATGWAELEGVMILTAETEYDADLRVGIAATNERALRDLLLAFPPGKVGFFYLAADWMLSALGELFDGRVMPSREGYYATEATYVPHRDHPALRLAEADYDLVRAQWSESVWKQVIEGGYSVHACRENAELCALCFHWQVAPWRHEVHGLQAVKDFFQRYAESAVASATDEVIELGRVATCTANLSSAVEYLRAFRNVGYQPFYRVHSFLGVKRGSGSLVAMTEDAFYRGSEREPRDSAHQRPGVGGQISKSKDPLMSKFRDLAHASGRREYSQFLVEGLTLVQRAIHDGLPVDSILYTSDLTQSSDGVMLLRDARLGGIDHYLVTEGLMSRVTSTRPVPAVVGAVYTVLREAASFNTGLATSLLVVENVNNPDNLGMILRTADAAGVEGVVVIGEKSDPFHKNCVRAARGAVGRIPILSCRSPEAYLQRLRTHRFRVVGATAHGETDLYRCDMRPPVAAVVGNEQVGLSGPVLEECTLRVRIPMAPGQDSLNVGVASGVLLYEILRQGRILRGAVSS